jgi:hypothetical protein
LKHKPIKNWGAASPQYLLTKFVSYRRLGVVGVYWQPILTGIISAAHDSQVAAGGARPVNKMSSNLKGHPEQQLSVFQKGMLVEMPAPWIRSRCFKSNLPSGYD